ncbi:hypothetical protein FB451DRAFT_1435068 [Mycena latifolia]|nr:hypothetical protein FB451DRAFT_1435068 [Mycena latifolia]
METNLQLSATLKPSLSAAPFRPGQLYHNAADSPHGIPPAPSQETTLSPSTTLLRIPPELRGAILDLCFPPARTFVQIIPYRASLAACRLNLPLAIYSICKLITTELEPLSAKLRRLDFTYIVRGPALLGSWRPEYGDRHDDDDSHFALVMRFAERVRLLGPGPNMSNGLSLSSGPRRLVPGTECGLRVLEVQPRAWMKAAVEQVVLEHMLELTAHPDVAPCLEIRLIRETADPFEGLEDVRERLRHYHQAYMSNWGSVGSIWVDPTLLDGPEPEVETDFHNIQAWLTWFQGLTRGLAEKNQRLESLA